jgi:hypothetical protein
MTRYAVVVVAAILLAAGCAGPAAEAPAVRIELPAAEAFVEPGAPIELRGDASHPDGSPVELTWDLGDGTTAVGPNPPPHRYQQPGTYVITLIGRDARGAVATPVSRVAQVGARTGSDRNMAIAFGGTGRDDVDRVKIPLRDADNRATGANIGATDFTIELWLRARPGANPAAAVECGENFDWIHGNIVLDRDRFNQGRAHGLSIAGGTLVFGVANEAEQKRTVCGRARVDDDLWHHVAVTRSVATGSVRIYVDGRIDGEVQSGPAGDISYPADAVPEPACDGGRPCTRSDPFLVLGAEKHDAGPEYPSFRGMIDELRLSTAIRYPGPFDPPQQGFAGDADTAALYHFDEGEGSVVRDAMGAPASPSDGVLRVGGDPGGPARVPSDAPTEGRP